MAEPFYAMSAFPVICVRLHIMNCNQDQYKESRQRHVGASN